MDTSRVQIELSRFQGGILFITEKRGRNQKRERMPVRSVLKIRCLKFLLVKSWKSLPLSILCSSPDKSREAMKVSSLRTSSKQPASRRAMPGLMARLAAWILCPRNLGMPRRKAFSLASKIRFLRPPQLLRIVLKAPWKLSAIGAISLSSCWPQRSSSSWPSLCCP